MWIDADMRVLIEEARKKLGVDKSRFARDAIVYYLNSLGYGLDDTAGAPARNRPPIRAVFNGSHNAVTFGDNSKAIVRKK